MDKEVCRILLADDDEDDRNFFRDAIHAVKMETTLISVSNGEELMDYLENKDNPLPHILFLDLNMPCKSGLDCLTEIRNNPRLRNLTIAIYSTSGSEDDIENTFLAGAHVYIRKPKDFGTLQKVLTEVLNINWHYHSSGLNRDNFLFSI
ncbi:MAG: response regulator [Flavobacterium sp.]|nr:response regulator [Flavobacterium sp.]